MEDIRWHSARGPHRCKEPVGIQHVPTQHNDSTFAVGIQLRCRIRRARLLIACDPGLFKLPYELYRLVGGAWVLHVAQLIRIHKIHSLDSSPARKTFLMEKARSAVVLVR